MAILFLLSSRFSQTPYLTFDFNSRFYPWNYNFLSVFINPNSLHSLCGQFRTSFNHSVLLKNISPSVWRSNLLTFTLLIFLVFELCVTFYTTTVISIFGWLCTLHLIIVHYFWDGDNIKSAYKKTIEYQDLLHKTERNRVTIEETGGLCYPGINYSIIIAQQLVWYRQN